MNDAEILAKADANTKRAEHNLRLAGEQYGEFSREYESYCEEMQGALEAEDESFRRTI